MYNFTLEEFGRTESRWENEISRCFRPLLRYYYTHLTTSSLLPLRSTSSHSY